MKTLNIAITLCGLLISLFANAQQERIATKDMDNSRTPFYTKASGFERTAPRAYALILDATGESVGISDADALANVKAAYAVGNFVDTLGYVFAVKDGKVSNSENLIPVRATYWFRDGVRRMDYFLREGCYNPVAVPYREDPVSLGIKSVPSSHSQSQAADSNVEPATWDLNLNSEGSFYCFESKGATLIASIKRDGKTIQATDRNYRIFILNKYGDIVSRGRKVTQVKDPGRYVLRVSDLDGNELASTYEIVKSYEEGNSVLTEEFDKFTEYEDGYPVAKVRGVFSIQIEAPEKSKIELFYRGNTYHNTGGYLAAKGEKPLTGRILSKVTTPEGCYRETWHDLSDKKVIEDYRQPQQEEQVVVVEESGRGRRGGGGGNNFNFIIAGNGNNSANGSRWGTNRGNSYYEVPPQQQRRRVTRYQLYQQQQQQQQQYQYNNNRNNGQGSRSRYLRTGG